MLVEDRASVEAELDERDPSRLRIDIRVHPIGGGSFGSDAGEIQRAIRDGFRDALREAQLERLMLASNSQPKRRGWLARVLGFVVCLGLGSGATRSDGLPSAAKRRRRPRGSWGPHGDPWVAIEPSPRAV